MFRTNIATMIGQPGMLGEGQCQWQEVTRVLRTHWYHVVAQSTEDGRTSEVVFMVETEKRLQVLLVSQTHDTFITDIQAVTPAYMNGKGGWLMEPLTKVALGKDQSGCVVSVLEVESGAAYHSSHQPDFDVDSLTDLYPIFLAGMIRPMSANSEECHD